MISIIFIALASILDAFRDVITDHFATSIFCNSNRIFFDHTKGSLGRKILGYYFDAWHLAKSLQLVCYFLAILLYKSITPHLIIDFVIFGCVYIFVFDLFYGIIFRHN